VISGKHELPFSGIELRKQDRIEKKEKRRMSATEVKEIVYHCECRRFVPGIPAAPCLCYECGRTHSPADEYVISEA
jgi:hypothetical protein